MNHHKLIKSMIAEIRKLRKENDYVNNQYESLAVSMEEHSGRLESRNQQLRDENDRLDRQHRQEQDDRDYKDYERRELVKKLERAESWGDTWGADRIKRKLKDF